MKKLLVALCLLVWPVVASGHDVQPSRDAAMQTFSLYAGKLRGDFFFKNGGVSDQVGLGMSIPDRPVRQDDGTWLVAGCRVKSCTEKAAIIATSGGEALAGGILYYAPGYLLRRTAFRTPISRFSSVVPRRPPP